MQCSAVVASLFLSGCATKYTIDDGSAVDEKLLSSIRTYGKAERAVRPAIVRSAQLNDSECDKQWELPFAVTSSHGLPQMDRIAWVRALQVDERLTVVAAIEPGPLKPGDKITHIDDYKDDADDMLVELAAQRDRGREFVLTLSDGRKVPVKPFEVCRGRYELTRPNGPADQDYHWLHARHAASLFDLALTPDEVLWTVLWTQGLSEEAGARMKTYHYGTRLLKGALTVASIASGVGAAANAASAAAANFAASEAGKAAAVAAGKELAKFAAEQAATAVRDKIISSATKEIAKAAAQELAMSALRSAAIFKSSLGGISWVAGTGFYMADKWAHERMALLGADPLAPFTLHGKLALAGQGENAFVFDEERLTAMTGFAEKSGMGERAKLALAGEGAAAVTVAALPAAHAVQVRSLDTPVDGALQRQAPLPATAVPAIAARTVAGASAVPAAAIPETVIVIGTTRYAGRFAQDAGRDTISGTGRMVWGNGDEYDGTLVSGQRQGKGKFVWANGQRYEGDWKEGVPDGVGTFHFPEGIRYSGAVRNGAPRGSGRIEFPSGDSYEGDVIDGRPSGTGTYVWQNGDQWHGIFENGLQTERGEFTENKQLAQM